MRFTMVIFCLTIHPVYVIRFDEYPLWIRNVFTRPRREIDWMFWQYTNRGRLNGYQGAERYIDINVIREVRKIGRSIPGEWQVSKRTLNIDVKLNEVLQIRRAETEDVEDIMKIMEQVTQQMAQSPWFVPSDAEYVKMQVAGDGLVIVAENGRQEIVAAFIVCFPGNHEENLGYDLHLPECERLKVAHMDAVIVHPRYRGRRLQLRLLQAVEQELKQTGYRYLMCTVHPENHYSLNNMKSYGYRIMLTREKYGGMLRHILCKTSQSWCGEKPVILVSSCLLGVRCRYNGTGEEAGWLNNLSEHAILIPVCPEVMGGLATPREPAERYGFRVITKTGTDVTAAYEQGAAVVLSLAQWFHSPCAVLKERSPSCGSQNIYDGTHSGRLIPGEGITAALLIQHGIPVFGESEGKKLKDFMDERRIL